MYGSPGYLGYGVDETRTTGEIMGAGWDAIFGSGTSENGTSENGTSGSLPAPRQDPLPGGTLNTLIATIQNTKVRTSEDLVVLSNVVLNAIKVETGKTENAAKFTNFATQSAAANTIPKQVAVLQRLAESAKKYKATRVENAIRTGVAKEFWTSVESPASGVPVKSGGTGKAASKSVDEMLKLPVYRQSWFAPTVGISTIAIILLVWKPWK